MCTNINKSYLSTFVPSANNAKHLLALILFGFSRIFYLWNEFNAMMGFIAALVTIRL